VGIPEEILRESGIPPVYTPRSFKLTSCVLYLKLGGL
jgi:hypothetical protein